MDPNSLSSADWRQAVAAVNQFWLFATLITVAALSFALAHGAIASLLGTRQIPGGTAVARPVLYVVSAVAFAVAVLTVLNAFNLTYGVLRGIYPRWWT